MPILDSDNEFPKVLFTIDGDDSTPDAGLAKVYVAADKTAHLVDDDGLDTSLGGSAPTEILDIPTVETDDTLVLAPDGAGGVEFRAEAGGGGSSLLAVIAYKPASNTTTPVTSTSAADIDAPNLVITFTAPASGNVVVRVGCLVEGPSIVSCYWALREGSTTLDWARLGDNMPRSYRTMDFLISGLSAGSHTFKWAGAVDGSTMNLFYGPGTTNMGAAIMEVWSAP